MSINHVVLAGYLTRDPELRLTQSGMQVLDFSVAVNERVKNNQTGEYEDQPNFFDCTIFGSRAETLSKYLRKGLKVTIDGKLHWQQWEKNGQKRTKVSILVNDLELPPRGENSQQNQPQYQQAPQVINGVYAAPQAAPVQQVYGYAQPVTAVPMGAYQQPVAQQDSLYDEDIPF